MKTVLNIKNEDSPAYLINHHEGFGDDEIIAMALKVLDSRLKNHGQIMNSPNTIKNYLRLKLATTEHEVFMVLFLDAQHQLIESRELFRGTLTQTSVYPREVVKESLSRNAAAVVIAHNHPSGCDVESRADILLTTALQQALALVDIKVLDHFIVAGKSVSSFAEKGLI